MKKKISPTIVGAFVAGALLLGMAALVSFGSGRLFNKPARFVVLLRQSSVSGLEPGASVKFGGVRVGRVEGVSGQLDPEAGEIVVRLVCDIHERDAAAIFPPPVPATEDMIPTLVTSGMSAKLNFSGITGLLYLDLVVTPEARGQDVKYEAETNLPLVPVESSVLTELTETLTEIAANLSKIDFEGISTDLRGLLGNLNTTVKDVDLRGTLASVRDAARAVEALANNGNLTAALEKLDTSMGGLEALFADVRQAVPAMQGDLRATLIEASTALKEVAQAAREAQLLVGERGGLGSEIFRTLAALRHAAESAEQLMDYLERNPSALLRGRATEETDLRR